MPTLALTRSLSYASQARTPTTLTRSRTIRRRPRKRASTSRSSRRRPRRSVRSVRSVRSLRRRVMRGG